MEETQKGLQPHEVRVVEERAELMDKITKLHTFMKSDFYQKLDEESKLHFENQEFAMRNYAEALLKRINRFEGKMENTVIPLTRGQQAVGIRFNPSNLTTVDQVKQLSAKIIDILFDEFDKRSENKSVSWTTNVLRTQAFTNLLDAQHSAVKFLTWED